MADESCSVRGIFREQIFDAIKTLRKEKEKNAHTVKQYIIISISTMLPI